MKNVTLKSLHALLAINVIISCNVLYSMETEKPLIKTLPHLHQPLFNPSGNYSKVVTVPTTFGPAQIITTNKITILDPYKGKKSYNPSHPCQATLSMEHIYIASHILSKDNKNQKNALNSHAYIHKWNIASEKLNQFINNEKKLIPPMAIVRELQVNGNGTILAALGASAAQIPFNDTFTIFHLNTNKKPLIIFTTKYCIYQKLEISPKDENIALLARNCFGNFLVHIYNPHSEKKHLATYYVHEDYKHIRLHPYNREGTAFVIQNGSRESCAIHYDKENVQFSSKLRTYLDLCWRCPHNNISISQYISEYWGPNYFYVYKETQGRNEKIAELTSRYPIRTVTFDPQGKMVIVLLTNDHYFFLPIPKNNPSEIIQTEVITENNSSSCKQQ